MNGIHAAFTGRIRRERCVPPRGPVDTKTDGGAPATWVRAALFGDAGRRSSQTPAAHAARSAGTP